MKSRSLSLALSLLAAALVGCAESPNVVASAEVLDRSLSLYSRQLLYANGTYEGCIDRSGEWCVPLADADCPDEDEPLSVVKDDAKCKLTLTSITTGLGLRLAVTNAANPPIALTTSYAKDASVFGHTAFYANARLSSSTFANNFILRIIFSDQPNFTTVENGAHFLVSSASVVDGEVPSPVYGLNTRGLIVLTDANDNVEQVEGAALLMPGPIQGQSYMVLSDSPGTSFASIDAAWRANDVVPIGSGPAGLYIGSDNFDLIGTRLPAERFVVVAREVVGVRSYQVITIAFEPADAE